MHLNPSHLVTDCGIMGGGRLTVALIIVFMEKALMAFYQDCDTAINCGNHDGALGN